MQLPFELVAKQGAKALAIWLLSGQLAKRLFVIANTLVNSPALIAMKIKFKLSQSTSLTAPVVIRRTVSLLEDEEYRVSNLTSNIVEFKGSTWKLRWSHEAAARLDGGKFELSTSGDEVLVTFSYYTSLTAPLLVFIAIAIGLISDGQYNVILFFFLFYLFGVSIQIITQRGTAKDILNSILNGIS